MVNEFPNCPYTISTDDLDEAVSDHKTIYVLDYKGCYCFADKPVQPLKMIEVTRDHPVSIRDVIEATCEPNYTAWYHTHKCGHHYFEGLRSVVVNVSSCRSSSPNTIFQIRWGS